MNTRLRVLAKLFWGESVRALSRHKLRTTLTALGIMVGVAAVIWVVAIGKAGTARALHAHHLAHWTCRTK